MKKQELRKVMLGMIARVEDSYRREHSTSLNTQLIKLIQETKAATVHTFLPMGKEADHTSAIAWCLGQGITVVTTKTLPRPRLKHLVLDNLDNLSQGVFGTKYPASEKEWTGGYDLILVPGLAFDKQGRRLGYGGGYYDAFLSTQPNVPKVAIAYPFQLVDEVPAGTGDVPVDKVFCGTKISSFR